MSSKSKAHDSIFTGLRDYAYQTTAVREIYLRLFPHGIASLWRHIGWMWASSSEHLKLLCVRAGWARISRLSRSLLSQVGRVPLRWAKEKLSVSRCRTHLEYHSYVSKLRQNRKEKHFHAFLSLRWKILLLCVAAEKEQLPSWNLSRVPPKVSLGACHSRTLRQKAHLSSF